MATKKTIRINPPAEKPVLDGTDFELDGKKYRFVVGRFIIPSLNDGNPLTAAEAAITPAALEYLVKNGSKVIEEIA